MKEPKQQPFPFFQRAIPPEKAKNLDFVCDALATFQQITQALIDIIDYFPDGICITDSTSHIIHVNKNWQIMAETTASEVVGMLAQDLVSKGLLSISVSAAASREKRSITIDQVMLKSGKATLLTCRPVFDEQHNVQFVVGCIRDISELNALKRETAKSQQIIDTYQRALESMRSPQHEEMVAESDAFVKVLRLAERAAKLSVPVLITGETGAGKEVIAQYIHDHSNRGNRPFVKINCGAIPPTLIESELFGYEAGSFTGSKAGGNPGLFEAANYGTILLDELGELPLDVQVKLLRVLQEKELSRIGSRTPLKLDVRVLCATNRNLEEMVLQGTFRQDLYFRINVLPVHIPPLRDRKDDIFPLARRFCDTANTNYGFNKRFSSTALNILVNYPWPGNIRELRNVVERAVILADDDVVLEDVIYNILYPDTPQAHANDSFSLKTHLERTELNYLNLYYYKHGNIRDAAAALGMSDSTFQRRRSELKSRLEDTQ